MDDNDTIWVCTVDDREQMNMDDNSPLEVLFGVITEHPTYHLTSLIFLGLLVGINWVS